ncbi:MAG TPA: short-chain dehydrogenase [Rhodospirillaceae bacterium]|jgi:NAD(P)-dependent dehydrogenase (short-subunit alcohol dehydrogenase family)|nr:SDR family NAD(P)-dependent oxidoreductase [Alphaproteobacteria bacterium]HBH25891.1 short-chain dehydrogenase [Rhodospirillaceae bacterium]
MTERWTGKHVWIVGASSGIGRALAVELAGQEAVLALSARRPDALETLNTQLGGGHRVVPLDVADGAAVRAAAQGLAAAWPRVDAVVFMAAVYRPGGLLAQSDADVGAAVAVNLGGALHLARAAIPLLRAQDGGGQLVLTASVAGYRGMPASQPYSATKAALIALAESLRIEHAGQGVDVRVINPGFVRTPLTDQNTFAMPGIIDAERAARIIARDLARPGFEVAFPRGFVLGMKALRALPGFLYRPLARAALRGASKTA